MHLHRGPRPTRRARRTIAALLLAGATAACGASPGAATPGPSSIISLPTTGQPAPTGPSGPSGPGAWQGTVTFHAVMNTLKDGPSETDATMKVHEETRVDVTDSFTVSGSDPEDAADYGVSLVNLAGQVANRGATLERYVYTSETTNALGCHYTDETGSEVSGPWTLDAKGAGEIRFSEDGNYTLTMAAGGDPVTGESVTPALPKSLWNTITILEGAAKDCPVGLGKQETTEGPIILWASSTLGAYDSIDGHLDTTGPGSVVDGSVTFEETLPEATVTVTWHLVHQGPIRLPHS